MIRMRPRSRQIFRLTWALLALGVLVACGDGDGALQSGGTDVVTADGKTGPRDIEAPEIFDVSEAGLWDGRPSLGGLWVAHPDVTDPHRVIIRNTANGKSAIGALFRRQRDMPGPRIQASSDAAEALAMLPGAPVNLHVTALIREPAVADDSAAPTDTEGTQTEQTQAAEPRSKGFRWPWAKPANDAAASGAGAAIDAPADVSQQMLEPAEGAALMPDPLAAEKATAARPIPQGQAQLANDAKPAAPHTPTI